MSSDVTTGLMLLLAGLLAFSAGLYGYVSRSALARRFADTLNVSGFYLLLPGGLGCATFGVGTMLWGHHPAMDVLLTIGLCLMVMAVILGFWHPRWIRPWWI